MPAQNKKEEKKEAEYIQMNGGNYRVYVGPRGGKYINVGGKKRYI
jgi:hypothetical protein